MSSRDLDDLIPSFRDKVERLYDECVSRGIVMKPFCTVRTPKEQACIWRKSRSTIEINQKRDELIRLGAPFLASCIEDVGPQPGKLGVHETHAIPGLSWHQFGRAVDSFWSYPVGSACWKTSVTNEDGQNGYLVYGALAGALGLTSLGATSGWDWPHVQDTPLSGPHKMYGTIAEIDAIMKERFGQ